MTQNAQYCYALDENNNLVNIIDAKTIDGVFVCPHCKSEMIRKCGKHNAWHFAHKDKQCDYNQYLHTLAKTKIKEWFNNSDNVIFCINAKKKCPSLESCNFHDNNECCKNICPQEYNLKQWFDYAELEKSVTKNGDRFIADILCHNKKKEQPLLLEICVSHPCEQKKINSGLRIIEFVIKSESDIDKIINSTIKEKNCIRFYNFKPKPTIGTQSEFNKPIQKFVLWPSLKGYLKKDLSCHELNNRRGILEISIDYDECIPYFIEVGGFHSVAMAVASQFINLKSCTLCKYQQYNEYESTHICKLYKRFGTQKYCDMNDSQTCNYFRRNESIIQNRIEAFNRYKEQNPVDEWKDNSLSNYENKKSSI